MARCTALFILVCLARVAIADTPEDDGILFPDDASVASPMEVELHLPLRDLKRLKPEESESFAAQLVLADGTSLPLEVSPRGKSRRKTCDFPPLWLNFKKKSLKGTLFEGQNKLKLVTHCKKSYAQKDFLAAEMLVYRLFNLFTDNSFRVRALHITYVEGEERLSH